jgi:hypothetical protein
MSGGERPIETLARRIRERHQARSALSLDPATTYEVVTRQMVEDLSREVTGVRKRVDAMFWVVITSIVVDVLLRLAG